MFLVTNETNKFVVVQSNELIEASYSPELTTRAHKVARLILSLISPDDKDLKLYTVPISTLKDFLGYKENTTWGNFYPELKDIADRLNKEPIVIKTQDKVTTAYFIAGYEVDSAARTVTFEVSLLLKPYLLALKRNFTRYPLHYIARLRSAYSIRLYELLSQYRNIGHRTFELAALQQLLGSNYEFYANFKDKVLTIAKRDLDANTDITFEYQEIKTARKVTALKFSILSNSSVEKAENTANADGTSRDNREGVSVQNLVAKTASFSAFSEETLVKLTKIGLKTTAIKRYEGMGFGIVVDEKAREQAVLRCENNLETYFLEKCALCEKSGRVGARNQAGFLVKALQEDWQPTAAKQEKTIVQKPLTKSNAAEIKRLEAQIRQAKQEMDAAKQPIYDHIIENTEGAFRRIFDEVREASGSLTSTIFPANESPKVIFQKNGMASNLLKIKMEDVYKTEFAAIYKSYGVVLVDLEQQLVALKNT
jgi:plasmid replication initiation protein